MADQTPLYGAGICDRCDEWEGDPITHWRCPTCGRPWNRRNWS